MSDFESSIAYVIFNEGGYVKNILDPGLATNFGITSKTLARARRVDSVTDEDVKNLTLDEAKTIYEILYWNPSKLEDVKQPIAMAIFDMVVNMGQFNAIKLAQKACGISSDGMMGNQTIDALNKAPPVIFMCSFTHQVLLFYVERIGKNQALFEFLNGWVNRAMRLLTLVQ